jgi:hypothetical protein
MKVTGTWHGEYTYGPEYGAVTGKSVPFVLSLTESWWRRFAGYVRDDAARGGQPERGRVAGKRRGAAIQFVKTMPVGYVTNDQGKLSETTNAWLQRTFGGEQRGTSPLRIHYSGNLSVDGQSAAGQWLIKRRVVSQGGQLVRLGGEGTWTARRISDLPTAV